MPTALIGEVGTNDITAPDWATGTVPANGDDVDAPPVNVLVQRLLNADADIADFAVAALTQTNATFAAGVPIIRNVATIAAMKALSTSGLADASVCVVKDPTITGNTISRLGLFVYDSSSTTAECPIPGIVDGYIVVTPNSGTGRWINVAAGLGWDVVTGRFLPRPRERVIPWQITGSGTGLTSPSLTTAGWTQLPPVVAPVLATSDAFLFDFDFSMGAITPADNILQVRVDVSYNGGGFTTIQSASKAVSVSSATTLDRHAIHIAGRIDASSGPGTYTLRLFGRCGVTDANVYFHDEWIARGVQYLAALLAAPVTGHARPLLAVGARWLDSDGAVPEGAGDFRAVDLRLKAAEALAANHDDPRGVASNALASAGLRERRVLLVDTRVVDGQRPALRAALQNGSTCRGASAARSNRRRRQAIVGQGASAGP